VLAGEVEHLDSVGDLLVGVDEGDVLGDTARLDTALLVLDAVALVSAGALLVGCLLRIFTVLLLACRRSVNAGDRVRASTISLSWVLALMAVGHPA
jgi:hypothetical protein